MKKYLILIFISITIFTACNSKYVVNQKIIENKENQNYEKVQCKKILDEKENKKEISNKSESSNLKEKTIKDDKNINLKEHSSYNDELLITNIFISDNCKDTENKIFTNDKKEETNNEKKEEGFLDILDKYVSAFFVLATAIVGHFFNIKLQNSKNLQEVELKKVEQEYNISKDTYQKLFEKKISIYSELHKMLLSHKQKMLTIGMEDYNVDEDGFRTQYIIDRKQIFIDFIQNLNNILKENMFYVSKEIEDKFLDISLSLEHGNLTVHNGFMLGYIDDSDIEKILENIQEEFFTKHNKNIENLISSFEDEIKIIKKKIDL